MILMRLVRVHFGIMFLLRLLFRRHLLSRRLRHGRRRCLCLLRCLFTLRCSFLLYASVLQRLCASASASLVLVFAFLFPPCLVPLAYSALLFLLRVSCILGIDIPIFAAFLRCEAQQC